jgi:hypothetical protein
MRIITINYQLKNNNQALWKINNLLWWILFNISWFHCSHEENKLTNVKILQSWYNEIYVLKYDEIEYKILNIVLCYNTCKIKES